VSANALASSSAEVKSRDSLVCIATDYGLDDQMIGVRIPAGAGNFSFRYRVQTDSKAHTASYPTGAKRPGCEADHSLPSSAEVKEYVELYLHSPDKLSWSSSQLKAQGQICFLCYQCRS
jgi:hypothetical protein